MSDKKNCKWLELTQKFHDTMQILEDFNIPSEQEIARYQATQARAGRINSRLKEKVSHGYTFYPLPKKIAEDITEVMEELGLPLSTASEGLIQRIETALERKELTEEFTLDWGRFNFQTARLLSIIAADDDGHFKRNTTKNPPKIWEQSIYAYWMNVHWIEGDMTKEEAEYALAQKILVLIDDKNIPTEDMDLLKNLLVKDSIDLKKTYKNTSRIKILKTLKRNAYILNALPKSLFS